MKNWYQSRTIWYAVVTALIGIISAFQAEYPEISVIALANSALIVILRMLTEKPIA